MLAVIAAYAENRVIGKDGCIPWDILEEKHRFRDLTMGHTIIMGRRTYEEIGRPLPGRETIVISKTKQFDAPHCITVSDLGQALRMAQTETIFVCGGEQLYRSAIPLADMLYLTEIHAVFDGDRYFPMVRESDFEETERQIISGDISYTYRTLCRKQMTYAQARAYIAQLTLQKGIVLGLEPMRELLRRLGNPQDSIPAVHIAGTNGKGSTLAMIASILRQAGYRTGSYHSPAVFEELECWQVSGVQITPEQYAAGMTVIHAVCREMQEEHQPIPTAFEQETALAFLFFARQKCDIIVIECGMGGEGDATNVLTKTAVSVLTSIGMDHTRFLGDTIEEIARTKAGILRPNVPAVIERQEKAVLSAVRQKAQEIGTELTISAPEQVETCTDGIHFSLNGHDYTAAWTAHYQAENAAAAVMAVKLLRDFPVSEADIQNGLQSVVWHGRMEQLHTAPIIVMDGAHNPNAAIRLREEVQRRWKREQLIEIVGVLADKDFTQVGQIMTPLAHKIITVTPNNPRALSAQALAECFGRLHDDVTAADSIEQALQLAFAAADEQTAILAFGSLSWLSELRRSVEEYQ